MGAGEQSTCVWTVQRGCLWVVRLLTWCLGSPTVRAQENQTEAEGLLWSSLGNHIVSILPYSLSQGCHKPSREGDIELTT